MKIGDKVKIMDCHTMPELIGQEGEIAGDHNPATSPYPFSVKIAGGLCFIYGITSNKGGVK